MLERYHEAMIAAVTMAGEKWEVKGCQWRTSPGGVAGISSATSSAVNLGLLIRRVVHVCASTMANAVKKKTQ